MSCIVHVQRIGQQSTLMSRSTVTFTHNRLRCATLYELRGERRGVDYQRHYRTEPSPRDLHSLHPSSLVSRELRLILLFVQSIISYLTRRARASSSSLERKIKHKSILISTHRINFTFRGNFRDLRVDGWGERERRCCWLS